MVKIFKDGKQILELSDTEERVIKNDIHADEFVSDMIRRIRWKIDSLIKNSYRALREEWSDDRLLSEGVRSVPLDEKDAAALIFSLDSYDGPGEEGLKESVISVDGSDIMNISIVDKRMLAYFLKDSSSVDKKIEDSIVMILKEKHNNCYKRMKLEWDKKLMDAGIKNIPVDKGDYAELVFSQPEYNDRKSRDAKVKV